MGTVFDDVITSLIGGFVNDLLRRGIKARDSRGPNNNIASVAGFSAVPKTRFLSFKSRSAV